MRWKAIPEREGEEEVSLTDASTISPPLSLSPCRSSPSRQDNNHFARSLHTGSRGKAGRTAAICGELRRSHNMKLQPAAAAKTRTTTTLHTCAAAEAEEESGKERVERGEREAGERANGHSHADMLSLLLLLLLRPSASSPHNPLNLLARSLWQIIAVSPPHGAIVVVVVAAAAAAQWGKQANFAIKLSSVLEEAESV